MKSILAGALAGAAGTTALNAVTYLDMAIRARPASSVPQTMVDEITKAAGHPVPGNEEQRQNRLAGLAPLNGIAVGVGVGAAIGLISAGLRAAGLRLPPSARGAVIGVLAMAVTNAPMTALGVTDPRSWSMADWLADLVPHLAYGATADAALRALGR